MNNDKPSFTVIIAMSIATIVMFATGCSLIKDFIEYEKGLATPTPTPLPTNTPIVILPFDTPTPTTFPTPDIPSWGFESGMARVLVEGLGTDDAHDKAGIFHLANQSTGAWLNVRYRAGGKFQPKGALNSEYGCCDEINYFDMKNASNGVWTITWGADTEALNTWTQIESPNGESSTLYFEGGVAAWREVKAGSGDARIPASYPATITVKEISGVIGVSIECKE